MYLIWAPPDRFNTNSRYGAPTVDFPTHVRGRLCGMVVGCVAAQWAVHKAVCWCVMKLTALWSARMG